MKKNKDFMLCDYILKNIIVKYDNVDSLYNEIENLIKKELIKSILSVLDSVENKIYYKILKNQEMKIKKLHNPYDLSMNNYNSFDLPKTIRPAQTKNPKIITD